LPASNLLLVVYSFLYRSLLDFRFSIRYRVSIRFRFKFFKYLFHSKILVLLVFLYGEFKLLLSTGRYSTWDQFLGFSGYFQSLTDVCGYFRFLADVCGYFRSLADIVRYLILVDLSGFPKFQFGV
jgi:hypothetical protein